MKISLDDFGSALRWWRTTRRFSQLQLANEAEVSSRHISFLETGKARPSREMVVHLGIVLELPLRDRNALLYSAGFAPLYPHSDFDAPEMNEVRTVLNAILNAHAPYPAIVVDRRGDIVDSNTAGIMMIGAVVAVDSPALAPVPNINRLTFHPGGIRNRTRNWEDVAANVLQRLEREHSFRPADGLLSELLEEVLGYPDVASLQRHPSLPTGGDLVATLHVETFGGDELELMNTIGTIGAPYDVTLDELRLETFFPMNKTTTAALAAWATQ
ncbi:MAG: helix-turn-helix domain-containing protein [Actinobacteria bacterium]|nr:helix-turn-helix domain-containing protein [Actinomycetota bacterium]